MLPAVWYCLELSLSTAAENLALDEALWHWVCLGGECPLPVLRIWESPQRAVVLGRASRAEAEVHVQRCRQERIPVLRRPTGGAAVVIGPGCRMYSLFWPLPAGPLFPPAEIHQQVLLPLAGALSRAGPTVSLAGSSDLVWGDRKISGNSLRWSRRGCWYHGTLLYDFELFWVQRLLKHPPREPQYRGGRSHQEFVDNYPLSLRQVARVLQRAWGNAIPLRQWPVARTTELYLRRYTDRRWNFQR